MLITSLMLAVETKIGVDMYAAVEDSKRGICSEEVLKMVCEVDKVKIAGR